MSNHYYYISDAQSKKKISYFFFPLEKNTTRKVEIAIITNNIYVISMASFVEAVLHIFNLKLERVSIKLQILLTFATNQEHDIERLGISLDWTRLLEMCEHLCGSCVSRQ